MSSLEAKRTRYRIHFKRSRQTDTFNYSRRRFMRAQKPNLGMFRRSLRSSAGRELLCRILPMGILVGICFAGDWPQYRGPNGSGVGNATRLPTEFGPEKNVVWKTPVPFGHSSPVITGDLIFITGADGGSRSYMSEKSD